MAAMTLERNGVVGHLFHADAFDSHLFLTIVAKDIPALYKRTR